MRSIKLTLCSTQFVLQSLLVAVFCFVLYSYVKNALQKEFAEGLDSYAQNIAARLEIEHEHGRLEIELEGGHVRDPDSYYVIANPEGRPIIKSPSARKVDWELPLLTEETPELGVPMQLGQSGAGRYKVVKFAPVIDDRVSQAANWSVFVAKPTQQLQGALDALLLGSVLCAAALIGVSGITTFFSVKYALRPLRSIEEEVAQLDTMTLDQRISEESLPSELKQIVSKINALLTRLDHGFQREKRFSSNAAHELRTPIAELKAILQVGMMSHDRSPEEFQVYFKDGEQVVHRMQRLLETLLAIVRNEFSNLDLQPTPEDLSALLNRYEDVKVAEYAPAAFLDSSILIAVLDNLIGNAREYGSGEITVKFSKLDESFSLIVCNPTQNLEKADLENIAEPFWRKEESRSDQSHFGLGLNLVQGYCSVHGWDLSFRMEEGVFSASISGIEFAEIGTKKLQASEHLERAACL